MALRKVTFNDSPVRAADHGALFSGIISDGIINGCVMYITGGLLAISPGYFVVAGRLIEVNGPFTIDLENGPVSQVVLSLDVFDDNKSLEQMIDVRRANNINSFSPLVKDDINSANATSQDHYEFEIAVVNTTNTTIIRKMPLASRPIRVLESIPASWSAYQDGIYLIKESQS